MKKSKFTESQIAFILRQADEGTPITEVCRKAGISEATFYNCLQVDGYAAYNRLAKPERSNDVVLLAGCWAHVRRRFYELHANESSPFATRTIAAMAPLWQVEDEIRRSEPEHRCNIRQQRSRAIVQDLFALWDRELPRLSGKSKLAEAIRYAISQRTVLERFLADGRIEIDSNIVERLIRPQAITRKNALFAGSDGGGEHWAIIASLVETCKLNAIDPQLYLADVITKILNGHPNSQIDELLPWAYPVSQILSRVA
jgi:transposase